MNNPDDEIKLLRLSIKQLEKRLEKIESFVGYKLQQYDKALKNTKNQIRGLEK